MRSIWGSRLPGNVGFKGKAAALISVAGWDEGFSVTVSSTTGGCVLLDLVVLNKPEILLSGFDGTFDNDGKLTDEKSMERMDQQLKALKDLSLKLNPVMAEKEL
mmetsp:Transcript_20693/g.49121  ORF Transcript_20693/g.49121 Transcript_20693/m.49121 type:complete len:104 (-) Transcript_20693:2301-2612(-)